MPWRICSLGFCKRPAVSGYSYSCQIWVTVLFKLKSIRFVAHFHAEYKRHIAYASENEYQYSMFSLNAQVDLIACDETTCREAFRYHDAVYCVSLANETEARG